MATKTPNLGLVLAGVGDRIAQSIRDFASNFQTIDRLCPVGRIIMVDNPDWNPETEFPGTKWTLIQGRFLIGATKGGGEFAVGSTGGTKSHYHRTSMGFDGKTWFGWLGNEDDDEVNGVPRFGSETFTSVNSLTQGGYFNYGQKARIAYTEGATNVPPYEAVFIWKRTG